MSRPPRIGILCEYASLNGGEMSLLAALDALSSTEVQPILLCPGSGPLASEIERREWELCPVPEESRHSLHAHWQDWVIRSASERNLDLLHANSLTMSRRLGAVASRMSCPTTGHFRDILKLKPAQVRALNQHRRLVAVSRATADFHREQGVAAEKLTVIHNGIDFRRFFPAAPDGSLHQELQLPPHVPLAATIGQICLRKGQLDLAQAAALLKDRCPDLHFLLIGERHSTKPESVAYEADIRATFASAGMSDRLHCLGFRSDIPQILRNIRLLVHPARQEPLGRVLLEAAACGVPLVATDVGGTREIVTHEAGAWLVRAGDPDSLADGIANCLEHPEQARRQGEMAHRHVSTKFAASVSAQKLLAFWKSVLSDRSSE